MLTDKQVEEIKDHLEKAQNPIFMFDNDPDGMCSFLIMRKFCGKGKGVLIRSNPLNKEYSKKITELGADYLFILDKPLVDLDFFLEVEKLNIPVVWIDHHNVKNEIPDFVNYYNPIFNKIKTSEPVTHLCYQISQRKEDLWLDIVGCTSDHFLSENYEKFKKEFPELCIDTKEPFGILYGSQIGRVAKIFSFALRDTTTNVVNMLKFLVKAKGPHDVLEENSENRQLHKRFEQVEKRYQKLFVKAKSIAEKSKKIVFFKYSSDISLTGEISNELMHYFPKKIIVIFHLKEGKIIFSGRGDNVREKVLKAIENLPDSRGGGHENAVGGQFRTEDLETFKENMEKFVK